MSWGSIEEAIPAGSDIANTLKTSLPAWWVRIRKFMAIILTDTGDTAIGSGADEDNPKLKIGCITAASIPDNEIDSEHYAAGSVDSEHLASSTIGANHLGDAASFENAQTRYVAVPLCGGVEGTVANYAATGRSVAFTGAGTSEILSIPIFLPNGAIVTNLYSYCSADTAGTMVVVLTRSSKTVATGSAMATNTHSGTGALNDNTISDATVNNTTHIYYVSVAPGGAGTTMTLSGIVITYTVTDPLM